MKLYHGSDCVVKTPSVMNSFRNLDFGSGFYLTSYESQARSWAIRKALRSHGKAYVNVYEVTEPDESVSVLRFPEPNQEWVEFVCACRKGFEPSKSYDLIIGGVANDKVYQAVNMYFKGYWDMETTLKALRYYGVNDQWCFASQAVLDACVHFVGAYEVAR